MKGLHAALIVAAWSCAPTLTPFNEKLSPVASSRSEGVSEAPEDHEVSAYARHPLTEKIVDYARSYCGKRRGGTVARDYAPDALIRSAGEGDRRGLDAIEASWTAQAELLSRAKCPGPQVFVEGGTAVILSAAVGTNTGRFLGLEPTGKTVGVVTATVDIFTPDGKIIEQREYVDTPTLLSQLGLYDKPSRSTAVPEWMLECHLATGAPEEAANARQVRHLQEAFEKRDARAYAEALADDVVWDDFTAPAPTRGKADVVKRFDALASAFSRTALECEPRGVVDYVVSECMLTGTQTGPLVVAGMQVAPTNRDVNVHTLEILQLRNHKVVRGWTYGNSRELAAELGVWNPAPPAPDAGD